MEAPKEYIITVRGTSFILFDDQIRRDAPNYFTKYFEGSFKEPQDGVREMKLNRDPYLFTFIHLYMSGYDVLPLPKDHLPPYLSEEGRLKNLLLDARFYGLNTLAEGLEAVVQPEKRSGEPREAHDGQKEKETQNLFTVIVRDQVFELTRDQLYRDAPNYFTAFFEGSFKESSEGMRELRLHRNPYLFQFVWVHLTGYQVMPLPKDNIPQYFSLESRDASLILDARFYGLDSLADELERSARGRQLQELARKLRGY